MKTAPFDREPPFVLLPAQPETRWQRSLRSIRAFFSGHFLGKHVPERRVQVTNSGHINSHSGNYASMGNGVSVLNQGCEGQMNYAVQIPQLGEDIPANRYNVVGVSDIKNYVSEFQGGGLNGALTHDGSYKLFKWDNAKGCMVPYEPSTPLVQRFQRSFDAFMRAWRAK